MDNNRFGFEEIEHPADWALRVWAPDLPQLFALAAEGMYSLMETVLAEGERSAREMALEGMDDESLLVAFLSELLYLGESLGEGYDRFEVALADGRLSARVEGGPILRRRKEIKAVTFHTMNIRQEGGLYQVTIVFDV